MSKCLLVAQLSFIYISGAFAQGTEPESSFARTVVDGVLSGSAIWVAKKVVLQLQGGGKIRGSQLITSCEPF